MVNGQSHAVTVNLVTALLYAQHHWETQFPHRCPKAFRLWADAICINQSDVTEISSQMELMTTLYSTAELVIFSLVAGDGIDHWDIRNAMNAFEIVANETKDFDPARGLQISWLKQQDSLRELRPHWLAMHSFFALPNFKRVWIFQELVSAKRGVFIHERDSVNYTAVDAAARWLNATGKSIRRQMAGGGIFEGPDYLEGLILVTFASGTGSWWRFESVYETRLAMQNIDESAAGLVRWDLFPRCRYLAAKDPKDHIYGLVGLTRSFLTVDKSLNTLTIYRDYVRAWIQDTKRADVLLYSGIGTVQLPSPHEAPSWVPNYPFGDKEGDDLKNIADGFLRYKADEGVFGAEEGDVPLLDGHGLFITGIIGPAVHTVKHAPPLESADLFNFAIDFNRRHQGRGAYVTGIHPTKAFFQAIIGDESCTGKALVSLVWEIAKLMRLNPEQMAHQKYPGRKLQSMAKAADGKLDSVDCLIPRVFTPDANTNTKEQIDRFVECKSWQENYHWDMADLGPDNSDAADYATAMTTLLRLNERQLCETEDGYLGMVPRGTLPGDRICVVKGCSNLVVLRAKEDHYIHVGSCYVLGLSSGEIGRLRNSRSAVTEANVWMATMVQRIQIR